MSETENNNPPSAPPVNLRSIYLYKIIQGHKIKWQIKVNNEMVIIDEGPANVAQFNNILAGKVEPPTNVAGEVTKTYSLTPTDNYKKVLDARGIKYNTTANGQIMVQEVPYKEKMIMQFFDMDAPPPTGDGVDALRAKYRQEIEEAGGTAGCTGCKLNSIQRKFRELLKDKFN
jgi:hypothetical protein